MENMIRRHVCILLGLSLAALVATPGLSCTTVCLLGKEKAVVAYNYDFYPPEGLVLVNKRGRGAGEVHFRTEGNRAIRRFALAGFDYS